MSCEETYAWAMAVSKDGGKHNGSYKELVAQISLKHVYKKL